VQNFSERVEPQPSVILERNLEEREIALNSCPAHILKHLLALGAAKNHQMVRQHQKPHIFNMRVIPGQILDVARHMLRGIGQPYRQTVLLQPELDSLEALSKLSVRHALFSIVDRLFIPSWLSPYRRRSSTSTYYGAVGDLLSRRIGTACIQVYENIMPMQGRAT
jgi:hypothetical protein